MGLVLDVFQENIQAIDLGRQPRSDRGAVRIGVLRQGFGGSGGVARRLGAQTEAPQRIAALTQGDGHAAYRLHVLQGHARIRHQVKADRLEPLADDLQAGRRQQMVHVGHAACDRVLHGNHCQVAGAGLHRLEDVLEARVGNRCVVWKIGSACFIAVRAEFALEADL